jgi:uncharacterized protein YebE (UPF0316 family)
MFYMSLTEILSRRCLMDHTGFLNSDVFRWIVLPLLIFIARILDVSFQTIRIMFVSRGNRILAPLLGFFEVLIWIIAIGQIMQNLDNMFCYLAYAGGFATGTYIGICLEERLAYGKVVLRIITRSEAGALIQSLGKKGFGITSVDAQGRKGAVKIIYIVINRSDIPRVVREIEKYNPKAFYCIEDTRFVSEGIFPITKNTFQRLFTKKRSPGHLARLYWRTWMSRKGK